MSKVLHATCVSGSVEAGDIHIPDAVILSEGVASSAGVAVFDQDKVYYLAKTSPDLKSALDDLASALGTIASALTTTATALTSLGEIASGVSLVANAASLTLLQASVNTLKAALK